MSFDAHHLTVPLPGGSPGGSKPFEASASSDAAKADIKTRFDRVLQSQSELAEAPEPAKPVADVAVEAITETAPAVFPQAAPQTMLPQTLLAETPVAETFSPAVPELTNVLPGEAVPANADVDNGGLLVSDTIEPLTPAEKPGVAEATSKVAEALMAALKAAQAQPAGQPQTPDAVAKAPALDLAAALMAAQLAASESTDTIAETDDAVTDAELEALLKTLPPELQALLQATAKPAAIKSDGLTALTNDAPANGQSANPEDSLALFMDKGADKDTADPALSAVKDTPVAADAADEAALQAAATSTLAQPTPAQASQSDTQALINSLSNRLNGATSASSAPSAATAQAYVMSNQTADNIASLAAQIHKKMDGKTLRFDMELRPSDMGRVDVRMEINADGKLSAHLSFDSPAAETEFRGRQDDLRRQLEQSGFALDDGSLSFSSRDQNPQQSGRDEHEAPVAKAIVASAQFSRTEHTADDVSLNNWLPGMDSFDSLGAGRLALNVRV